MGYFMAKNLAIHAQAHPAGSPPLVVWNRNIAKSEALLKDAGSHRVRIAQSPGEVARDCDIIVTNLASDDVVRDIYKKFAADLAVSQRRYLRESHCRI
jgi:3-hydroxyisobutyrate dehydrogenase-like beta-hydroxyacid dehydrogenase